MVQGNTEGLTKYPAPGLTMPKKKGISAFFTKNLPGVNHPSLIHFSSMPLYRLEQSPEKYAHLLRKKDLKHIGPIVNYFISGSGHVAFLGGDVVRNLYLRGKKKYKVVNILAILTGSDIDKYSFVMNNIISSNDGAFAMGFRYRVKKNRTEGCFADIPVLRYVIEPRFEGIAKLLYPFRPASIELDLTTQSRFSSVVGVELQ